MIRRLVVIAGLLVAVGLGGLVWAMRSYPTLWVEFHPIPSVRPPTAHLDPFTTKLVDSLSAQTKAGIKYRDGYYDGGDPPEHIGVCTDVVIRAFRNAGVDLKDEVASDIRSNPGGYSVLRPDPNIDHRRCRNLIAFFKSHARELPDSDWRPGDVVFWSTHNDGRTDHVGMIACGKAADGDPSIVHHWPGLPVSETDGLHRFQITGHFRWRAT